VPLNIDEDELVEHWTLVGEELGQVAGKRGTTRLGFALLLKFYTRYARFPRGRGELPEEAMTYVARQVGVSSRARAVSARASSAHASAAAPRWSARWAS
jgi:Domain of unknown function (DUF4158)